MTLIVLSGVPLIRRHFWNSFYFLHLILIVVSVVTGIAHEAGAIMIGG